MISTTQQQCKEALVMGNDGTAMRQAVCFKERQKSCLGCDVSSCSAAKSMSNAMLPGMTLRFMLNKTGLKESGRHLTHTQQKYILMQQNYTNLRHITVAMTVHESSQLHHTPIPAIIGGGLAEHDLRYFGKDLTHALAACIIMAASGREHGDVTDMHRWNTQPDKPREQSRMSRHYNVRFFSTVKHTRGSRDLCRHARLVCAPSHSTDLARCHNHVQDIQHRSACCAQSESACACLSAVGHQALCAMPQQP